MLADMLFHTPWTNIFKGVDLARGTNIPPTLITNYAGVYSDTRMQAVFCLRVDLTDPDIELVTNPQCTNCGSYEVIGNTTSGFLEANQARGAINGSFFTPCCSETPGARLNLYGLYLHEGQVVSPAWTPADYDPLRTYYATLLFTSNNLPAFVAYNNPSTNLALFSTGIAGDLALLTNGVIAVPSADWQPRSALGLSQDHRYLYLMSIDGRQGGYSDGATDLETAAWLRFFGAWEGMNVDGGGGATLVMSDGSECSQAVQVNRPIEAGVPGRERVAGGQLGFRAKLLQPPLVRDIKAEGGYKTATITWTTTSNATSQVEYGTTPNYGNVSVFDPTLVTNHTVTLNNL